jgi:integrase
MTELNLDQQIAKAEAEVARLKALATTSRPVSRRLRNKLTNRRIATLGDGFHSDGGSLYLRVRDGRKSWIVRHKDRDYGLGGYPATGLAEARDKRDTLLKAIKAGRDPIADRHNQQQAVKLASAKRLAFAKAVEAFIGVHEKEWKNPKHRIQWQQSLVDYAYPVFGTIDCALIDADLVFKALEPIWGRKTKTASDIRGRVEKVLDYAASVGVRPKDQPNPALWRGNLEHRLAKPGKIAKVEHMAAMPHGEVPGLWAKLVADNSLGALALRFLILTGCRSNEVLEAPWSEIDLDTRTRTIAEARMKGGVGHRVPLSDAAIEVLHALQQIQQGPFLFTSMQQRKDRLAKPVSPMLMRRTLAKLGHAGLTVHGFRTSLRGWGKQHGYPREVLELALAHYEGSKTQKAYDRDDLLEARRELIAAWSRYVAAPAPEGKVIPLVRQSV